MDEDFEDDEDYNYGDALYEQAIEDAAIAEFRAGGGRCWWEADGGVVVVHERLPVLIGAPLISDDIDDDNYDPFA